MTSSKKIEPTTAPLELVHIDLLTDLRGHPNYHFALVAVDDYSSYVYVKPLLAKSEALQALKDWVTAAERATGQKLMKLRSDNGGEWFNLSAIQWEREIGFKWQQTVPHTSVQNGKAERTIRSVQEQTRAMMFQRAVPKELWPYAVLAAAHTINLTPSITGKIPYEEFYKRTAHGLAQQLRVFGCLAWVHLPKKDHVGKYGVRAIPGIMAGYDEERKGWRFYTPDHSPSIRWSNSATFHEQKGWHQRRQVESPKITGVEHLTIEDDEHTYDDTEEPPELEFETTSEPDIDVPVINTQSAENEENTEHEEEEVEYLLGELYTANGNTERLLRKVFVAKGAEKLLGSAQSATLNLTPTLKEAFNGDDAQQWHEAIRKELEGLEAMGTWEIVDKPEGANLVDSRIILRLKLDADGIPIRHKARLVARGFTQREGIDFEETFAPVAPVSAIRGLLALAVERDWETHQLDITQAYLNSTLKHVIYMKPPNGSNVPEGKVYLVKKGLYGLKQSGREWHLEFDKFLRSSNFHRVDCAPCVYTRGTGDNFAIVVIYVDDTLIIAPKLEAVNKIKQEIKQRWKMEDGQEVSHFLGIKLTRDRQAKTLDMEQSAYIKQILEEHLDKRRRKSSVPLQDIPVPTTVASPAERKAYPQIVGKLLWLANGTRPDISQAVSVLARYMTRPSKEHFDAAQKVLHYLDQTQDICLRYGSRKEEEQLLAHSDANWASNPTTQRKSSSGSAVFVHGNLVAWKSALQRCTALSAVEAEFVAATEAAREILFFQQLFKAIGIDTGTPTILSDNTGTIQVSKDPQQHWKLKHIDTKYHFIRDNVQDGKINIKYINTADNLADIFTKPVGKESLRKARNGMGLIQPQRQRPSWPAILPVEGGS
ncbi:related to retrotransposon protein [Melanopsichium pennsylvanicum]|uniref:Related to retrotransposon protein n=2 Tax=Melanopsichium pennsylvanicum TaxID=63383 RepID=A0AAJ5C602_9BASI|nr:related to retrotransposon protein [Melanopsichium pennsylvanicum]